MRTAGFSLCVVVLQSACAVGAAEPNLYDASISNVVPTTMGGDAAASGAQPGVNSPSADAASAPPTTDAGRTPSTRDAAVAVAPTPDAGPATVTPAVPTGPASTPGGNACGAAICNDEGARTGSTCADAMTIGRGTLLGSNPEYINSTQSSGQNQDLSIADCEDEGNDFFYRIYLYPGEVLNLSVRNMTTGADPTIKFYFSSDCSPPTQVVCIDDGPKNVSELIYEQPALGEGWHYIVIDGPSGVWGQFSITKTAPLKTVANACSC